MDETTNWRKTFKDALDSIGLREDLADESQGRVRGILAEEHALEHIEEIEKDLFEEALSGRFDWMKATVGEGEAFFEANPKILRGADHETVLMLMATRTLSGDALSGFKVDREEGLGDLGGRDVVKAAYELAGDCHNFEVYRDCFKRIDDAYWSSGSFETVFTSVVYRDCPAANQAFLDLVEEQSGQKIHAPDEYLSVTQITAALKDDVTLSYWEALTSRYASKVARTLREGGKYQDLLAIDPGSFGLPTPEWATDFGVMSQNRVVLKEIHSRFKLGEGRPHQVFPLRDIAHILDAPISVVLSAVTIEGDETTGGDTESPTKDAH